MNASDIFNQMMHNEASWCYDCVKRNGCNIKERVAFEEQFVGTSKYLKISAECTNYIKDGALKTQKNIMDCWKEYMESR